ncbi:MAG: hypothetical protein QM737_22560 [Ferruginibacter sp.]
MARTIHEYHTDYAFDYIDDEKLMRFIMDAMNLLASNINTGENEDETIEKLYRLTNNEPLSINLYRFIPTALCRLLFSNQRQFSERYTVQNSLGEQITFTYDDNRFYQEVEDIISYQLEHTDILSNDDYIGTILSHSRQYHEMLLLPKVMEKNKMQMDITEVLMPPLHFKSKDIYEC